MSLFIFSQENRRTIPWSVLITFSFLTIGILLIGYYNYKSQRNKIIKDYQENITAIALLKTKQIELWHTERLGDAELLRNNKPLVKSIKAYFRDKNQTGIEKDLIKWMESLNANYDYNGVFILDTLSKIRLELTKSDSLMIDRIRVESVTVLKDLKIKMTDLYRTRSQEKPYIDLLVPISDDASKGGKPFGIIILRIDPEKILFPLIQSWPTPSKSSETLLVRKERDSVLFLSELRFKHNTSLRLSFPVSTEFLPAALAGRGINGLVEGFDYRNKSVVAYLTEISGTDWHLIAKVDKEEFLLPLKNYLFIEILGFVLLMFIIGSLSLFWIWNQRLAFYKQQLSNERSIKKLDDAYAISETRFRQLFEVARDGILILDADTGLIVDMNPFLTEMLGVTKEKILEKPIWEIGSFKDVFINKTKFLELQKKGYVRYDDLPLETEDARHVNVEFVSNVYMVDNRPIIQCNIRDITKRKEVEEALQIWNNQFKKLSSNAPGLIYQFTRRQDGSYYVPIASEGIMEIFGCTPDDVKNDFSPIADVLFSEDRERVIRDIEYSAKNLTFFTCEFRVQIPGKSIQWIYSKSKPERLPDGCITWFGFNSDITERKQLESDLVKREERFRSTLDNMLEGCQIIDFNWNYIYINDTADIQNRRPKEELLGKKYTDVWPGILESELFEKLKNCLYNRVPYHMENEFVFPDGAVGWFDLRIQPVPEGLFILSIDITERKKAEKALAESEERFRSMYENVTIGMYRTTTAGKILLANPAMISMMGFDSFEQLSKRNLENEGYEPDYPRSEFHKIMEITGKITGHESAWHKNDGSVLYVRESASAVKDHNGRIIYYDGTVEDITSRKQIEKSLEIERTLLRTLIDLLPSLIFVKDTQSRFLLANSACAVFMGADTAGDLIGKTDFEFYEKETADQFRSDESDVLNGKSIINKEEGSFSPGGVPRNLLTTKVPLRDNKSEIIGLVGICFDITERIEAEESLRISEKKFRDTIMNLDEGYYNVTTAGILIDHNQAFSHILGFDKSQDLRGFHLPDFWQVPEDRIPYLKELTLNGSITNYLINAKKHSGEKIKVLASAHLVKDEDNYPCRIEGIFLDITKLKRAEDDLRLKNLVFDASIAANSISDTNGEITEANNAFLRIWGYTDKNEVLGVAISEFFQNENEAVEIVTALNTKGQWEGNYTGKRKDGSTFIAHGLATDVKDESGFVIGYQSAVLDVTESLALSKEIEEERNKLASLLKSIPDEVWYADSNKKFTLTNPSALKEFGLISTEELEIEEFAGSLEVFLPDGTPRPLEMAPPLRALAGETVKNVEEVVRIPGNIEMHHRQVSAAPVKDSSGKIIGAISVARDITDLKKAEIQIRKLNEELEQRVIQRTEQLEAANKELEAFSYSVSHDLRSPLRAVHSFTNILLEDYEKILDDEGKRICGIISSSAMQMGELIDDLLSFSRIGRSTMNSSSLDMKFIANSVFDELLNENEKKRIKLKIGKLYSVYGDPGLIRLVWNNLISNAIKYSSKKSVPEIVISSKQEDNNVVYSVKDNGVGFDMQYKQKLFGVFQRLHNESEFEGNGVGLAIVQRIILRHEGKVWAESEAGNGAKFYFSLPAGGDGQQATDNRKTKNPTPDSV
jgi:PAS domain S-box-containing protein